MSTRTFFAAVALSSMLMFEGGEAQAGGGVGILGDSYSDEYQFYAPHREKARNWVEILGSTRSIDFGEFRTSSWGGPRNSGFAYNWAKSGATTASMIAEKQHEGLADQIAKGDVAIAVVFVGGNDFIEALHSSDPRANLQGLGRTAAANVKMATETLLAASPNVKVVIATVPDVRELPEFRTRIRERTLDPAIAASAVAEIDMFNAELRRLQASTNRIAIFDFAKISKISQVLAPTHITVAGRKIERERVGDSPDRLFLGDSRHLGTVAQGMLAKFLADCLNKNCGTRIKPLDEREIVELADRVADSLIAVSGEKQPGESQP